MRSIPTYKETWGALLLAVCALLLDTACHKKAAQAPPPPPPLATKPAPPPARPEIALFRASPSSIQKGQSSSLRWEVKNANDVKISPSIGEVQPNGSRTVYPSTATTYTLTARGPGGEAGASTSITVTIPPAPAAATAPPPRKSFGDLVSSELQDAYFDFDQSDIRSDAKVALQHDATALKSIFTDFSGRTVLVEGHCDERGSAEYNLALGDRRAQAARDYLVEFGVPADKLKTISYGKEQPVCTEHNEECWQRNRRAHFSPGQPAAGGQ